MVKDKVEEKLRDEIIETLEKKNLIHIEGDEDGIGLYLNEEGDGWKGESIIDIFKEGIKFNERRKT